MLHKRIKEKSAPLCYPSLILLLCKAAGVDLNPFLGGYSRMFTLGHPIPLPPATAPPSLHNFISLRCFEDDKGTFPETAGSSSRKRKTASSSAQTKSKASSSTGKKRARVILETVPETEASLPETGRASSEEQSVQPRPADIPTREIVIPGPSAIPQEQATPQRTDAPPPPQTSTAAGSGGASAPITIEMMMALFREERMMDEIRREERRRERDAERRREEEERRRERELERKREEEERERRWKRDEEERELRREENRRRDEEARRRDEMILKQLQENTAALHTLIGVHQHASPLSTIPAQLALQARAASSTPSGTQSETPAPSPSQQQQQTDPAVSSQSQDKS